MKTLVAPEIEAYAQAQSMPESDVARAAHVLGGLHVIG